jgi:hypothetical protein
MNPSKVNVPNVKDMNIDNITEKYPTYNWPFNITAGSSASSWPTDYASALKGIQAAGNDTLMPDAGL